MPAESHLLDDEKGDGARHQYVVVTSAPSAVALAVSGILIIGHLVEGEVVTLNVGLVANISYQIGDGIFFGGGVGVCEFSTLSVYFLSLFFA